MSELEPRPDNNDEAGPGAERPEDWVEPQTDQTPQLEVVEGPGEFVESPEMTTLRSRIEGGEHENLDLWTSYYELGAALADADGGSALAKVQFQLKFAEMKVNVGYTEDAREDLEQLLETPEMDQHPDFGNKVRAAYSRTS